MTYIPADDIYSRMAWADNHAIDHLTEEVMAEHAALKRVLRRLSLYQRDNKPAIRILEHELLHLEEFLGW